MAQIRVKINPATPSLETVRDFRDFGGLMYKFKKYYTTDGIRHMLYRDRKRLVYIVLIIIFLLLLLFSDEVNAEVMLHSFTDH